MSRSPDDEAERWEIIVSDLAESDLGEAYRYLAGFVGVGRAEEWVKDFYLLIASLGEFPGPYANAKHEEASLRLGRETRRMLYRGPRKRPVGTAYKAFYFVTPAAEGEEEGVIFIHRIVHGSSNWPDEPANDETES